MTIDSCYEGILATLTSQGKILTISHELLSVKTNNERVICVYKIIEKLQAFPSVEEMKKSNDLSIEYRNLGNNCFNQSQYHKAWQYYNVSLLNACVGSEAYCLAISNRSAAFFELAKYHECIKDIDKFFTLEYPEKVKLVKKLKDRREMCEQLLKKQKAEPVIDLDDMFKIKSEKDSRYLAASTKLEVVSSEEMGRHVIAKEDINVGEAIIEEEPYCKLVLKSQYLFICNYCLSTSLNLLPCDSCCFSLYCSDECKEKAWNEFHKIECGLMKTLIEMNFTKLELLALRTVIKARTDHTLWNDLFKTIQDAEANIGSKYHGHVKINGEWIYDSMYYTSIHTLETNIEKRSVSDIFQKAVTAAVFLRYLKDNTTFLQSDNEEETAKIFECVAGLLLLHLMTTPTNMHGLSSIIGSSNGVFVDEVNLASAPYAFCSLLNHSCAPNVVRFHKLGTGKVTVFVLRPIKKGMQIFDNYGPHHALENLKARQSTLKFQYKFTCLCEACVNIWPSYINLCLRPITKVPATLVHDKNTLISMSVIEQLQKGNVQTALRIYKNLCDLCQKLEPYAPSLELCECQESFKQCLAMFQGFVPYGSSLMIEWEPVSTTN